MNTHTTDASQPSPVTSEAHTETVTTLFETVNVTDAVLDLRQRDPQRVVYAVPNGTGGWMDVTVTEFVHQVSDVARGLIGLGLQPGDRIAVMAPTSYSWAVIDQAIWFAGGVSVPIYESSSAHQVAHLISDSGAHLALAGSAEIAGKIQSAINMISSNSSDDSQDPSRIHRMDSAVEVSEIASHGRQISDDVVEQRRSTAGLHDVATIVYTSGTTGKPRGVEITHGNLAEGGANITAFASEILGTSGSRTLLFLPLAHVLARAVQLMCLQSGVQVAHSAQTATLLDDLASFRPTWLLAVPRVFEKVYHGASESARSQGKGKIFDAARRTAIEYSEAVDAAAAGAGSGPEWKLKARHRLFSALVYPALHQRLGGNVRYMVCGASALSPEITHFFRGVGLPVQEGYGLTESTAPITLNIPGSTRVGTVGIPVPGSTVRIAHDGEILLKGSVVFSGYYADESSTSEAFTEEGVFRTGDLGALDRDGYLTVTGRKKELIVTAGGKNVSPTALEESVRADALVSQCVVVGDNRPFIAALVSMDAEGVQAWAQQHGKRDLSLADAAKDDDLRAHVQACIDTANQQVSRAESIRAFRILDVEFGEDSGYVTPSMKLQRYKVIGDFTDVIEDIYSARS